MKQKEKKVYIVSQLISFPDDETIRAIVRDWLTLCQLTSTPQEYYLNDEYEKKEFDLSEIKKIIDHITTDPTEDTLLTIKSEENEFSIHAFGGNIRERILLDMSKYMAQQSVIDDYIDQRMTAYGLYAYIRDIDEFLAHNVESLSDREVEEIRFPANPPIMYNDQNEVIVDCSQLAGFDSYYRGLCFTSCWKMWYSAFYYNFIPKQAFLDVQQVHEIKELKKEIIKITLYENPTKWQHPQNLKYQMLFRDQLGFDQLEWSNGVGVLREPYAEFMRVGGSTQMIQYQNRNQQPTTKSQSQHFTTRVFNYEINQYVEGRKYGSLNTRAYFPWQDNVKKTMVAYWILNPEFMVDKGVNAFNFYINQYLDVTREEEETKEYKAILRFYLPANYLKEIPMDKLIRKLTKEEINVRKENKKKRFYRLEKAEATLQVEFVDMVELEKLNNQDIVAKKHESLYDKIKKNFLKYSNNRKEKEQN